MEFRMCEVTNCRLQKVRNAQKTTDLGVAENIQYTYFCLNCGRNMTEA